MIAWVIFAPLFLTLLTWAIWDILVLSGVIEEELISVKLWELSKEYPMIPFTFGLVGGILSGHFFWRIYA